MGDRLVVVRGGRKFAPGWARARAIYFSAAVLMAGAGLMAWDIVAAPRRAAAESAATEASGGAAGAAALPAADDVADFINGVTTNATYVARPERNVLEAGVFEDMPKQMPVGWTTDADPFVLGLAAPSPIRSIRFTSANLGKKIEMRTTVPLKPEWKTL